MRIIGGVDVQVLRPSKDRFGDTVSTLVGTITGCVLQPGIPDPTTGKFQETSENVSTLFAPRSATLRVQARDRLVIDGRTYAVVGDRLFDHRHPATGRDFGYYSVRVETVA